MKTLCVSYDSCAGLGQGQVPARNNNASIRSSGLLAGGSVVVRDETAKLCSIHGIFDGIDCIDGIDGVFGKVAQHLTCSGENRVFLWLHDLQ